MKLTLKNFKCHRNKEIEIPDSGLISLSGDSGAGKSTILVALCYALFGKIKGKVRKPYSHGTKTASVKVELPTFGLVVFRSSSPTRLLVEFENQEYEDEAAQEIIENVLGLNYDTFTASSYVVQNSESSVLTMTPTEQFNFIQKIAFDSVDEVEDTKTKIKETISFLKKDNERKEYGLKHIREQFSRAKDLLPPKRTNPLNIDPEVLVNEVEELENNLEEVEKKIRLNRVNLDRIRQIEFENSKLEREKENLKDFFNTETVDNLNTQRTNFLNEASTLKEKLEALEVIVNFQNKKRSIQNEYDKFIATTETHTEAQEREKEKIKRQLEKMNPGEIFRNMDDAKKEYEKFLMIHSIEKKRENTLSSISKIREVCLPASKNSSSNSSAIEAKLHELLSDNKSLLKMKTEKTLECPCCETKLIMNSGVLQAVDGFYEFVDEHIVSDSVKTLSEHLRILQSLMRSEIHHNEELKSLGADLNTQLTEKEIEASRKKYEKYQAAWVKCSEVQQKLKEIENSGTSNALFEAMKAKIMSDLISFKVQEDSNPELGNSNAASEKSLTEKKIHTLERTIEEIDKKIKELSTSRRKYDAICVELEKRRGEYKTSKEYEEKDAALSSKLTEIVALIREKKRLVDASKEYTAYQRALDNLEELSSKIEDEETTIKENKYNIEGYALLEKMVKDAEIIALERTIDTINIHAQQYIEQMFSDPIIVKLMTTKNAPSSTGGGGSTKFSISTYIEYKGAVYDNIDELSGGERQRCELAYLLALNDVLGSKVILLDECLNNLDATINTDVLTFLRERCSEKMILVISHEAVKGVFDHEVFV